MPERREYTPELQREAVELTRTAGVTVAQIARELGTRERYGKLTSQKGHTLSIARITTTSTLYTFRIPFLSPTLKVTRSTITTQHNKYSGIFNKNRLRFTVTHSF